MMMKVNLKMKPMIEMTIVIVLMIFKAMMTMMMKSKSVPAKCRRHFSSSNLGEDDHDVGIDFNHDADADFNANADSDNTADANADANVDDNYL